MYSPKEKKAGQEWIERKLKELAKNLGVTIQGLKWREIGQNSTRDQLSLVVTVNGKQEIEKFNKDDIADCVSLSLPS